MLFSHGALVQRQHSGLSLRQCGFDSRAHRQSFGARLDFERTVVTTVPSTFAALVEALKALPLFRTPSDWISYDTPRPGESVRVLRSDPHGFSVLLMRPEGPRNLTHAVGSVAEAAELVMGYAIVPPILAHAGVPAADLDYQAWGWRRADPVMIERWARTGLWDAYLAGMAEYLGLTPEDLQPVLPPGDIEDQWQSLTLTQALKEAEGHEPG